MIRFEVAGETWKEILKKLEGMFPRNDINIESVLDTVEKPEDSFKTELTPSTPGARKSDEDFEAFKKLRLS